MKTKIEIKSIWGSLLFEYNCENNSIRNTLLAAIKSGADLSSAGLSGADLSGADHNESVLDIQEKDGTKSNITEVSSNYKSSFIYKIGEVVEESDFDTNRWIECSSGIHFFISRELAVRY